MKTLPPIIIIGNHNNCQNDVKLNEKVQIFTPSCSKNIFYYIIARIILDYNL